MSRHRKIRYYEPQNWEAAYARGGPDFAGLPPPGARTDLAGVGDRSNQHLPHAPMIFGAAVETPEHKEERERRLRLARLMAKHGLDDDKPWPWRM